MRAMASRSAASIIVRRRSGCSIATLLAMPHSAACATSTLSSATIMRPPWVTIQTRGGTGSAAAERSSAAAASSSAVGVDGLRSEPDVVGDGGPAARDQDELAGECGGVRAAGLEDFDAEACLLEECDPGRRRRQSMSRPEVCVGEHPHAVGQAEGKIAPHQRSRILDQQERAVRAPVGDTALAKRGAQRLRGMQHVGRHDDVGRAVGETLVLRRPGNIERRAVDAELLV